MQSDFFFEITNLEHIDSLIVVSKSFSLLQITPLLTYSIIPPRPSPIRPCPFRLLFHNHLYQTMQMGTYHLFLFHFRQSNPTGGKNNLSKVYDFISEVVNIEISKQKLSWIFQS